MPKFEIDEESSPPTFLVDDQVVTRAEFLTRFEKHAPDRRLSVDDALAVVDVEKGLVTGDAELIAVTLARELLRIRSGLDKMGESLRQWGDESDAAATVRAAARHGEVGPDR